MKVPEWLLYLNFYANAAIGIVALYRFWFPRKRNNPYEKRNMIDCDCDKVCDKCHEIARRIYKEER